MKMRYEEKLNKSLMLCNNFIMPKKHKELNFNAHYSSNHREFEIKADGLAMWTI